MKSSSLPSINLSYDTKMKNLSSISFNTQYRPFLLLSWGCLELLDCFNNEPAI